MMINLQIGECLFVFMNYELKDDVVVVMMMMMKMMMMKTMMMTMMNIMVIMIKKKMMTSTTECLLGDGKGNGVLSAFPEIMSSSQRPVNLYWCICVFVFVFPCDHE